MDLPRFCALLCIAIFFGIGLPKFVRASDHDAATTIGVFDNVKSGPRLDAQVKRAFKQKKFGHFIARFRSEIGPVDLRNIRSLGATIVRYLPENALVFRAKGVQALTIAESSRRLLEVTAYPPELKIDPDMVPESVFYSLKRRDLEVRFFPGVDYGQSLLKLRQLPQVLKVEPIGDDAEQGFAVGVEEGFADAVVQNLAKQETVEWIGYRDELGSQQVNEFGLSTAPLANFAHGPRNDSSMLLSALWIAQGLGADSTATAYQKTLVVDERSGIGTGETHVFRVVVRQKMRVRAVILHHEMSPSPVAPEFPVNRISLSVHLPGASQPLKSMEIKGGAAVTSWTLAPGNYEVRVFGVNVPFPESGDRQPYVLVIGENVGAIHEDN